MTIITIEIESNLEWTAAHTNSGVWVAECEPLGLTMEGKTPDELHDVIGEACGALFADLLKDDELDDFLQAHGWRATNLPETPSVGEVEFDVPWSLVAMGGLHGSAQRSDQRPPRTWIHP